MNIYLIEKVLKFKYLSSLIEKSNKTLSFYVFSLKEQNVVKRDFKSMRISTNFLKILLTPSSRIKWNWLLLFKGTLSIVSTFNYNFNCKTIQKFLKQNIVIGGFLRNIFFSAKSFDWFFSNCGKNIIDAISFRFQYLTNFVGLLSYFSFRINIVLYMLLKKFFLKLLNVYVNSIN